MVLKSSVSVSKSRKLLGEEGGDAVENLTYKLTRLKKEIQAERVVSVGEKIQKNKEKLELYVSELQNLATSREDVTVTKSNNRGNFLSLRMVHPLYKFGALFQESSDRDFGNNEEVVFSSTAKLPLVEKIPPYTTWIFLDRNQRMADDQSVVGRRRIYYDQHGSEALICSDSEEELAEAEGAKHEFSRGEDRILRMALQEHGDCDDVLNTLSQYVGGTTIQIQERCNTLKEKDEIMKRQELKTSGEDKSEGNTFLDKSLSAALDSFDTIFCRRCLVFDCRLHGWSQTLVYPSEKQPYTSDPEEDRKPCGDQCYLRVLKGVKEKEGTGASIGSDSKPSDKEDTTPVSPYAAEQGKRLTSEPITTFAKDPEVVSDDLPSSCKKLKLTVPEPPNSSVAFAPVLQDLKTGGSEEFQSTTGAALMCHEHSPDGLDSNPDVTGEVVNEQAREKGKHVEEQLLNQAPSSMDISGEGSRRSNGWKPLEKDLYLKGIEIFGKNSCLIARNLLPGLKTCIEVSRYMYGDEPVNARGSSTMMSSSLEDAGKADMNLELEMPVRPRMFRRRGRTKKLRSSWKSAGHPSLWRRIADGKEPYKQYTPCGCKPMCGKLCPCRQVGTCCEKYCGCSRSCKNRFRGCHCAKSQCRSRQCPCYAAGRECDPDVCRNCWVSCGGGSLGEPPRRGGDSQCGNMRLYLRQQQKILLAKSDVAGWGAFLKNTVNKNDYLGEYTGELISHREADKRGKIYDRANSSFLFDLNDQFVLDAFRKGDKLKFANHSSTPNCYAKVMWVAGDHRVGIFANERIEAGEEIFYDYRYGPDQAPAWARRPEGSRRGDSPVPQGRARKHQTQ